MLPYRNLYVWGSRKFTGSLPARIATKANYNLNYHIKVSGKHGKVSGKHGKHGKHGYYVTMVKLQVRTVRCCRNKCNINRQ